MFASLSENTFSLVGIACESILTLSFRITVDLAFFSKEKYMDWAKDGAILTFIAFLIKIFQHALIKKLLQSQLSARIKKNPRINSEILAYE
jgi:hypothetical protein